MEMRSDVLDVVCAHAKASRPAECCGALLGDQDCIAHAAPLRNEATRLHRFEVDHLDLRELLRKRGIRGELIGFYHSHAAEAGVEPSIADRASAAEFGDEQYHLIVVPHGDWALYRIRGGVWKPVPTRTSEARADADHR